MKSLNPQQTAVALGSDHGGFALKENIKEYLTKAGYKVTDCGTKGVDPVDYPEFAHAVAQKVSAGKVDFGIVIDGAGIGSAMVANKIRGVRAALCYDLSSAKNAREHNNANVLTLGAGLIGSSLAIQIVEVFLNNQCSADRHLRRVDMINKFDGRDGNQGPSVSGNGAEIVPVTSADIARIAQRVGQLVAAEDIRMPSTDGEHCRTDMICKCGICLDKKPETIRKFIDFGVERIGYHNCTGVECVPEDIAHCIDHTLLKPMATKDDIKKLCAEAEEFKFATVCISPSYVKLAAQELSGSEVKVCTVVGFPSGAHTPEIKAMEARRAIRDGAKEIDMVINIGALKSGDDELVYRDIRQVCEACEDGSASSKVIIETTYLTEDEKVRACKLAKRARANYVKTSTGFGPEGATAEDVALMSRIVGQAGIGVKAAGGIKSYEDAQKMIMAGATRIGASAGIKIIQESKGITISN